MADVQALELDLGIGQSDRQHITDGLSRLLAETYTLYLKTQNYHWNVTGPLFASLHLLFEAQYRELAIAVDGLAERIRALGEHAPGSYHEFSALSSIPDDDGRPDATEMVRRLVQAQGSVLRTARAVLSAAERAHDQPTADLVAQRMEAHEKSAWMLRSLLER